VSRTRVAFTRHRSAPTTVVILHRGVRCKVFGDGKRGVQLYVSGVYEDFTWDHDAPTLQEIIEHIDWWLDQDEEEDANG